MLAVPKRNKPVSLFDVALEGDVGKLAALIEAGGNVNEASERSLKKPLHFAVAMGHTDAVEHLIAKGADVNAVDKSMRSPLYSAATQDNPRLMDALLVAGADIDRPDYQGVTPLHEASCSFYPTGLSILLNGGAKLDAKTMAIGESALHNAALNAITMQHLALLVDAGADIDGVNDQNETPLHYAVKRPSAEAIAFLVSEGAVVTSANADGKTALDLLNEFTIPPIRRIIPDDQLRQMRDLLTVHQSRAQ